MIYYSFFKVRYNYNPNKEFKIAVPNGEQSDSHLDKSNISSCEEVQIIPNIEHFSSLINSTWYDYNRRPFTLFINTVLPYHDVFSSIYSILEDSPVQLTFIPDLIHMSDPDNAFWFTDLSKVHAYDSELKRVKAILSRYKKYDTICVTALAEHCAHLQYAIDTITDMQDTPSKYPNFDEDELKVLVEIALPELKKHYTAFKQYQKDLYNNPNKDVYVVDIHSTNIVSSISNPMDYYITREIENAGKQTIHLANMLNVGPEDITSIPNQVMEYLMAVLQGYRFLIPPLRLNCSSK